MQKVFWIARRGFEFHVLKLDASRPRGLEVSPKASLRPEPPMLGQCAWTLQKAHTTPSGYPDIFNGITSIFKFLILKSSVYKTTCSSYFSQES